MLRATASHRTPSNREHSSSIAGMAASPNFRSLRCLPQSKNLPRVGWYGNCSVRPGSRHNVVLEVFVKDRLIELMGGFEKRTALIAVVVASCVLLVSNSAAAQGTAQ